MVDEAYPILQCNCALEKCQSSEPFPTTLNRQKIARLEVDE